MLIEEFYLTGFAQLGHPGKPAQVLQVGYRGLEELVEQHGSILTEDEYTLHIIQV
ncbi:MAG TPA: hypothetical protein VEI04_09620 [Syntrophobacteria bacterium]|nr:hypothetical protein [Syntrophobacteria bacterium]